MKTFNDLFAREWTVAVSIGAVKRVRDLVVIDLLRLAEDDLLPKLAGDPMLLVDVLHAVCRPQALERDLGPEDFAEALGGDALEHATEAFLEELVAFFPMARRQVFAKGLGKMRVIEARGMRRIAEQVATVDESLVERELEACFNDAMKLPDSSA